VGSFQTALLTAVSESGSGGEAVAEGTEAQGFAGADSMSLFSTVAQPVTIAQPSLTPSAAISPNGRYAVWATAACRLAGQGNTRSSAVYVLDETSGQPAKVLSLPDGWTQVGFLGLSVGSLGGVTGLVTHSDGNICLGSYHGAPGGGCFGTCPQAGPDSAVLTASPGANAFRVVATANAAGEASVSTDRDSFVLCSADHGKRDLSVVVGDRLRIARAPFRIGSPFCAAGDSGVIYALGGNGQSTSSLLASAPDSQVRLPSPGHGQYHQLGVGAISDAENSGVSPDGRAILIAEEHFIPNTKVSIDGVTRALVDWNP
jgi:hypothetical protein